MKLGLAETVMSCALDRISSNTVSLLKRHYSIDDVLSRGSVLLHLHQHTREALAGSSGKARQTVTITEFQLW